MAGQGKVSRCTKGGIRGLFYLWNRLLLWQRNFIGDDDTDANLSQAGLGKCNTWAVNILIRIE